MFPTPRGVTLWVLLPLPAPLSGIGAFLPAAVTCHLELLQLGDGMGARVCLGPLLLLLLLPPLPGAEHGGEGSGVAGAGSDSLAGAGGDRTWLLPSIIGGCEARQHSRPYMVSLQFGGVHRCGAALLHQRWVLTAAHCQG